MSEAVETFPLSKPLVSSERAVACSFNIVMGVLTFDTSGITQRLAIYIIPDSVVSLITIGRWSDIFLSIILFFSNPTP